MIETITYIRLSILIMALCAIVVVAAILSRRRLKTLMYIMAVVMLLWQVAAILVDNQWMSAMAVYIIVSFWIVFFCWLVKDGSRLPDAQR